VFLLELSDVDGIPYVLWQFPIFVVLPSHKVPPYKGRRAANMKVNVQKQVEL
jgi:hypothetical protein